ncbi:MAG: ribose-5-phosphate isomerase RpiA [Alphaproteobacteria bacterium]|nr:ribose-5-phosphate isomerase RpiA [Alphaproteobacteria bacterium]
MDQHKRIAAEAAIGELESGMRLGLGTGSTARIFVELLGRKVAAGFECICVPTSTETAVQARELGIPLTDLDACPNLDLCVDGADELNDALELIKGGGGAHLREKIVAAAAARMIVIADRTKRVDVLGRFALPIEIEPFGAGVTLGAVRALMARHRKRTGDARGADWRMQANGDRLTTDGGHYIADAFFGRISDPETLASELNALPGIIEHGLFIGLCRRAYIGGPDGVEIIEQK